MQAEEEGAPVTAVASGWQSDTIEFFELSKSKKESAWQKRGTWEDQTRLPVWTETVDAELSCTSGKKDSDPIRPPEWSVRVTTALSE